MGAVKWVVDKAIAKANGGCPGSPNGKHKFTSTVLKDKITGQKGVRVSYCSNSGCGRMAK